MKEISVPRLLLTALAVNALFNEDTNTPAQDGLNDIISETPLKKNMQYECLATVENESNQFIG